MQSSVVDDNGNLTVAGFLDIPYNNRIMAFFFFF